MSAFPLFDAVQQLATQTISFSETDLGQPFSWRAHDEGVRFALIGTYHELRELAVQLAQQRQDEGPALTTAQRALAPYHAAYRDLQAVLLGIDEETWDRLPGPGDWPLRSVLAHIVNAERTFFALVHYGLQRQRSSEALPLAMPADSREVLFGPDEPFYSLLENGSMVDVLGSYDDLHRRALAAFSQIDDQELQAPSLWWEGEEYSLQYRLHRFDAHLRQHTIQAEKVREQLGQPASESLRLLRLVYQALAEVESLLLGAGDLALETRQALAEQILARSKEVVERVARARELLNATREGNAAQVRAVLADHPALANAIGEQGLMLLLEALYRGRLDIAELFVEAEADLSIMEGAALGRQDVVAEAVAQWPGWVNEYNGDGFTPLQLACFFGHEETALYLLEQGADVHAVARNQQQIQPLHAAAAGPAGLSLLTALLDHGADPNARQQRGFTALHTAAQQGDINMARLLLQHGADPKATDDAGRTPADFARQGGHHALVVLLEEGEAASPSTN